MSEQRAKEFIQSLAGDPDLRTRLTTARSADERKQIVQQAGYGDVEPDEVRRLMQPGAGSELSDEQLASIAGGWFDNVKAPPGTFDNIQISWW